MNLLFTLDENYAEPLMTTLGSMFASNMGTSFSIYILHAGLSEPTLARIGRQCARHGSTAIPILISEDRFAQAPVPGHYTTAMYYRLLAYTLLPHSVDKILYLDPDILVINRLDALYATDVSGYLYAAASHGDPTGITDVVNKVRLAQYESAGYFNTGVLLMNLEGQRAYIREDELMAFVDKHRGELILPDQDVLNAMYGDKIAKLDDSLYNYDARWYDVYRVVSGGEKDLNWVMRNTVILHFCGKNKPWHKSFTGRFAALYKHYMRLVELEEEQG